MTALAGFLSFDGGTRARDCCERMLAAQQVYAPAPPRCWSGGEFAGGRRLFALLPEDRFDHAPVRNEESDRTLVADVRLDNRDELCAELGVPSPHAASLSDTAVLMRALDRWDQDAIPRLAGDFAFALWDGRRKRLLMARDYLGMRPLHFHRSPNFFAFASMPKGLHALPQVPREVDEDAVAQFLALMPANNSQTFFAGIERVQPGYLCTVDRSGTSTRRYWDPSGKPLRLRNDEDYVEAVREQMDRAVAARLRGAGGRIAAQLSGGLDSGAVTATAARLLSGNGEVTAFTSVPREGYDGAIPRGRFGDEGRHAAAVAALYPNIEHVLVRTGGASPLTSLDRNVFLFESPVLNLCNAVWGDAILDTAKQRGFNVMLTGDAGNMSFSYSGMETLPELVRTGRLLRLATHAVRLRRNGIRLESVAAHAFGPFLSKSLWKAINRARGRHYELADYSAINPSSAATLSERAEQAGLDTSYRPRRDAFETRLWSLARVDPGSFMKGQLGGWGIDARDATADRRLVELCLCIPAEQYLKNGQTRSLARRAFADRLPDMVIRETRKGLQAVDWHEGLNGARSEAAAEFQRIGNARSAAGSLDMKMMQRLLDQWPTGGWDRRSTEDRYRLSLLRGLSGGHFIRKVAGDNG